MKLAAYDVLLVIGVRGSGKTYWTQKFVVNHARRVVVFDPHGEYRTVERRTLDEVASNPAVLDSERISLSVVPDWRTPADLAEQFAVFCELISSVENIRIVVDEVGLLTRHGIESIEYVACQSRHWQAPLVLVAQRAVQVPKTAREQASKIVSFRQSSPSDVAALVDRCGDSADKVKGLPRYEHWVWSEEDSFIEVETEEDTNEGLSD